MPPPRKLLNDIKPEGKLLILIISTIAISKLFYSDMAHSVNSQKRYANTPAMRDYKMNVVIEDDSECNDNSKLTFHKIFY